MKGTNKPMNLKKKAKTIKPIRILNCETVQEALYRFLESNRLCGLVLPHINKVYKTNHSSTMEALLNAGMINKHMTGISLNANNLHRLLKWDIYYVVKHYNNPGELLDFIKLLEVAEYNWVLSVYNFSFKRKKELTTKGLENFISRWDDINSLEDL